MKRVWYAVRHMEDMNILQSFCPGGKLRLGAQMLDGRVITSMGWEGWEGSLFLISAEYR